LAYSTEQLDKLLETYTLEEILEYNDISEAELLSHLDLKYPPVPVDFYEET